MTGEAVSFSLSAGELTVRDEAGGGAVVMDVDDDATLTPATDAWFDVPVDDAVSVETESVEVRQATSTEFRGDDGEYYGSVADDDFTLAGGTYVDISAALKLLLYVEEGPMDGSLVGKSHNPESLRLVFDVPTRVVVGARSRHESPIETITTGEKPEDLMTAASYLGSSIKEWSAERSWPTLRGHPPAIEVGEELRVPDDLSIPETDVSVAVPRDTADVLRVTPLAHYFGAEVVPGDRAEIRLGNQYVEPLGSGAELEQSVEKLLAHALVLDSLVRIGGYYSMRRYEYDELAPELPFYPPELYDEPIHRQLMEYLEVPYETVLPYAPDWLAVGNLRPEAVDAEAVPYLLNGLYPVHVSADGLADDSSPAGPVQITTNRTVPRGLAVLSDAARRRSRDHVRQPAGEASLVFVGHPSPSPAQFEAVDWERFELEGTPTVSVRQSVTREELRSLLAQSHAYVHFGHRVSETGFVCSDGILPFDDLPNGGVGAISFEWPWPSTGPLDGIPDVASVACLLEGPLDSATAEQFAVSLAISRSVEQSAVSAGIDRVRYLGNPTLPVTRRPTGHSPLVAHVTKEGPGEYEVSVHLKTDTHDIPGGVAKSRFAGPDSPLQLAGTIQEFDESVSAATLSEILHSDTVLRLEWSSDTEGLGRLSTLDDLLPE
jgi:hypothetical protein